MSAQTSIKVLLVEDHAFTRDGLRALINVQPDFEVVAEARSGEEALEKLETLSVDVVLLDIGLPAMDGIETALRIRELHPHVRMVMLTAHSLPEQVFASLASGADAYCLKTGEPEWLLLALKAAYTGSAYLDPQIAHLVLGRSRKLYAPGSEPAADLTERELDVLRRISDGKNNKEIASELGLSVGTVKNHVQEILVKLSASDRTQAAVRAVRSGLL